MTRTTSILTWSTAERVVDPETEVYLAVVEYYAGNHPHFVTERLVLQVGRDDDDVTDGRTFIEAEVVLDDLLELGVRFLSAYRKMRDQRRAAEARGLTAPESPVVPLPISPGPVRWEYTYRQSSDASAEGVPASPLEPGWEPFAVVEHAGESWVHLRRRTDGAT